MCCFQTFAEKSSFTPTRFVALEDLAVVGVFPHFAMKTYSFM